MFQLGVAVVAGTNSGSAGSNFTFAEVHSAPVDRSTRLASGSQFLSPKEHYLNYQGIVFDFNGTLLFDMDLHELVWHRVSQLHLGRELTDEEWHHQFVGRTNAEIWPLLLGHESDTEEVQRLSEEKEAAYRELLISLEHRVTLVEGAVELFETCLSNDIEYREVSLDDFK